MREILGVIDPIAVRFLGIKVHWYGVIIGLAIMLALYLAVSEGKRQGLRPDDFYDYLLYALPIALICARIYYVIFQWDYYKRFPAEIYRIWDGGIAIYGGLLGALLVLVIFCKKRQLSPWLFLDVIAPTVILAQGIGRWGNFINQEAHGEAVSRIFLVQMHLPNFIIEQMNIGGTYYQPTFLYESVWDILGFLVLILLRHRKKLFKQGEIFLTYVAWYSFGRFFIEGMRTDSLMLLGLRVSQWLSVILFIGALSTIIYRRLNNKHLPWYLVVQKDDDQA